MINQGNNYRIFQLKPSSDEKTLMFKAKEFSCKLYRAILETNLRPFRILMSHDKVSANQMEYVMFERQYRFQIFQNTSAIKVYSLSNMNKVFVGEVKSPFQCKNLRCNVNFHVYSSDGSIKYYIQGNLC